MNFHHTHTHTYIEFNVSGLTPTLYTTAHQIQSKIAIYASVPGSFHRKKNLEWVSHEDVELLSIATNIRFYRV